MSERAFATRLAQPAFSQTFPPKLIWAGPTHFAPSRRGPARQLTTQRELSGPGVPGRYPRLPHKERDVIETNQPGYRIVGKVIAHAPCHGIIRETGYPNDELPE